MHYVYCLKSLLSYSRVCTELSAEWSGIRPNFFGARAKFTPVSQAGAHGEDSKNSWSERRFSTTIWHEAEFLPIICGIDRSAECTLENIYALESGAHSGKNRSCTNPAVI